MKRTRTVSNYAYDDLSNGETEISEIECYSPNKQRRAKKNVKRSLNRAKN
jgi:hypothetical protein